MYEGYYGLRERPFELTPNPRYLYLSARHREALSNLKYGLLTAKSVTLLLGEAGTGKTTLLRTALESDDCRRVHAVCLNNPALTRTEFVEMLAARFEFGPDARRSKAVLLESLEGALRDRRGRGEITALVIDEAQSLTADILEEVRLLANFETATEKLMPLVLAGQRELGERLDEAAFRQLKQRVALRCEIAPFNLDETASYIATRITRAGGQPARLFTREAVAMIHDYAGGIPRTINVICDNALVNGVALHRQPVDRKMVLEVCGDFALGGPRADVTAPAGPAPDAESPVEAVEPATGSIPAHPELFQEVSRPRWYVPFATR